MFKKKWLLPLMFILILSLAIGCTNDAEDPDDNQTVDPDVEEDLEDAEDAVDNAADETEDAAEDAKDKVDETVENAEEDVRDMNYDDIVITPEEAFDKFMELHPDSKITEIDLDKELMEYQYVIEGYDGENDYEVKINPVDGEVISDDSEAVDLDDDNDDMEITKDHLAKIDSIIEKAKAEDGSDSKLDEWNISSEDGKIVMEVEIGVREYSYDMDSEELLEKDM